MLHPTSLPGGRLDADAYSFVDWLEAAGQSWWQVLPLGPPDDVGSPYASSSAFAAWSGFLAEPGATVSARELDTFRKTNAYWIDDWERAGGSVADQVRFEREWTALRAYARERGVGLIGDVPIYPAHASVDHLRTRSSSSTGSSPALPRTRSARSASIGAIRSSTGMPSRRTAIGGGSSGCAGRSRSSI